MLQSRTDTGAVGARTERVAQRLRRSRVLRGSARLGLAARALMYLILAYLAAAVAAGTGTDGRQANANGALSAVAATPFGAVALAAAAVGFLAFALARLAGAVGDHGEGRLRRVTTAGQAAFYLGLGAMTTMFLVGRRSTGSEQQQDWTVSQLTAHPLGRVVLAVGGVAILCVCAWQVWIGVRGGFADSLRTDDMPPAVRRVARIVGTVGISARAIAVAPIGVLLLIAAFHAQPRNSRGLDELLREQAGTPVGRALVWLVAAGFLVFAGYSLLEAGYRRVHAGN